MRLRRPVSGERPVQPENPLPGHHAAPPSAASNLRISPVGMGWVLEAVLDDISRRDVSGMVNLGDSLYGPLDPSGTAELLIGLGLPTVRGNQDSVVVDGLSAAESPTLRFVREDLQSGDLLQVAETRRRLTLRVRPHRIDPHHAS